MAISISGLSGSGLDTTSIIQSLMDVERVPYTNLEVKKSNLESQQAVFRQLNTKLNSLQLAAADLRYVNTYEANKGTSSNTGTATVTADVNAVKGSFTLNVTSLAQQQVKVISGVSGTDNYLASDTAQFNYGSASILIKDLAPDGSFDNNKEALEAIVKKINSDSDADGTATLVETTGNTNPAAQRFTISYTAKESGAGDKVNLSFTNLGTSADLNAYQLQAGQNAKFTIDGVPVERASNTVTDAVQGVNLTLQNIGTSTISVERDTAGAQSKVQNFVNAYNDLIDLVNKNLAKPDDDNSINPLQGDSTLKQLKDDLYGFMTSALGYDNNSKVGFLEEIGISIDAGLTQASQFTGKITFDTTKFSAGLQSNFAKATAMLTSAMDATWSKLSVGYTNSINGSIAQKITGFDSQIKVVDERLESLSRSLEMKEARLKQQFTAMETMLSSLNNQSSWLTSQFDALTKTNSK